MGDFVVAAWWRPRPESVAEVEAILREMVASSRAEPGCLAYEAHRDLEDEATFFLYERYTDAAAYEAHQDSEHFHRLARGRGLALLASRERRCYEALESPSGGRP